MTAFSVFDPVTSNSIVKAQKYVRVAHAGTVAVAVAVAAAAAAAVALGPRYAADRLRLRDTDGIEQL